MGEKLSRYINTNLRVDGTIEYSDGAGGFININLALGTYKIVADLTARDAIPSGDRMEGLRVLTLDKKETWVLFGGITNTDWYLVGFELNKESTSVDLEFYIDEIGGDDFTGDGSIGTPWATLDYALRVIPSNLVAGNITLICAAGDYHITDSMLEIISYFNLNNTLTILGSVTLVRDDFTATAAVPDGNPFKRLSTVTWSSENQYMGYCARYDNYAPDYSWGPILAHGLNDLSGSIVPDGFWIGAIYSYDTNIIFDSNKGFKALFGSSSLVFQRVNITFGIVDNVKIKQLGATALKFSESVINVPLNKVIAIDGNVDISKSLVLSNNTNKYSLNITRTNAAQFVKGGICNVSPATSSTAAIKLANVSMDICQIYIYGFAYGIEAQRQVTLAAKYGHWPVVFENCGAAFKLTASGFNYQFGEWYGVNRLFLYACNYLASLSGATDDICLNLDSPGRLNGDEPLEGWFVPVTGGLWQGNPTLLTAMRSKPFHYIDSYRRVSITYPGLYPENSLPDPYTLLNGGSDNIIVGDTAQNKVIFMNYTIYRGTDIETGSLILTNKNDTYINRQGTSNDDAGIIFTKNINGTEIRLGWQDVLATGDDSQLELSINRQMI